ncbi:MAG: hypothetical protein AAF242_04585, partial [Bacteroidota bacterium]
MKTILISLSLLLTISNYSYAQGSVEAAAAAAEAGIEVANFALDKIWKYTGMDDKPYVHAFYVDIVAASTSTGHVFNGQDGDQIIIKRRPKQRTARENFYHFTLKQPNGNWWKAINAIRTPNTFDHEMVSVSGSDYSNKMLVDYEEMFKYFIVLSKAK